MLFSIVLLAAGVLFADSAEHPNEPEFVGDPALAPANLQSFSRPVEGCGFERTSYGPYTIWRQPDLLMFTSGMAIDADGSPRAYHPEDKGLDLLVHAGNPGDWFALATDENGEPIVQGEDDPAPNFYISMTSLADHSQPLSRRFIDAELVPYIALPNDLAGPRLGDLAVVVNTLNGRQSGAIYADVSPRGKLGEGSIALAKQLGINPSPRVGGAPPGVVFMVFLRSASGWPLPPETIQQMPERQQERMREAMRCLQVSAGAARNGNGQ